MAMSALNHAAKHSKVMKFILGGFIFFAVGGLVFMDVGGYFRGGANSTTVATVGDYKVDIRDFDPTLHNVLLQANITPQQAYNLGIVHAILQSQIDDILRAQTAADLRLNISNKAVAAQLQKVLSAQLPEGADLKEHAQMLLRSQGISERQIADSLRNQMQMSILNRLPMGVVNYTPSFVSNALAQVETEKRSGQIVTFSTDRLITDSADISDEEIESYYDENIDTFTVPAERVVLIGRINKDMVKSSVPAITEDDVLAAYEENQDEFLLPAKRLIAQVVVKDEAQARKIHEQTTSGKSLEQAVQDVTGGKTGYRAATAYAQEDLPNEFAAAAFADSVTAGTTTAPVKTVLGWYILEVQGFSEEKLQSFAEVKSTLKETLQTNALYDQLYGKITTAEDMQDSGENFTTIANEIGLRVTKTKSIKRNTPVDELPEPLKSVVVTSPDVMNEIFELAEGMPSYPIETDDEEFIIFGAESVKPQSYRELADVRDEIVKSIQNQRRDQLARAKIVEITRALNADETTLDKTVAEFGGKKQNFANIDRTTESHDGNTIFATKSGGYAPYITGADAYGIVTVTSVTRDQNDKIDADELAERIRSLYGTGLGLAERHYMRGQTKIRINEDLLKQQYAGIVRE